MIMNLPTTTFLLASALFLSAYAQVGNIQCPPGYTRAVTSIGSSAVTQATSVGESSLLTSSGAGSSVITSIDDSIPTSIGAGSSVITVPTTLPTSITETSGSEPTLEARQVEGEVPSGCVPVDAEESGRPDDDHDGEDGEGVESGEEGAGVRLGAGVGLGVGAVVVSLGVGMVL
ncbi:hypothetical protein BDV98DRAFT_573893 [Pterulicium gracile]|uniref:Uncharacterized protein n=1 Tax=Pterulicium gracile TaxID=1884261 RepID=A0A5C3QCE3_9AGAR|nr:hypothetical protein BDV98DRAFT_573893 [Pterula gracilis]